MFRKNMRLLKISKAVVLVGILLELILLPVCGKTQVLVDSLNGSSIGQVMGGVFVDGGGWSAQNWDDMILYDLGQYIVRGKLQVTLRNFEPETQNTSARHHILSMYSDSIGDHNHETYLNGYWTGKSIWNIHTGFNYLGGMKFLTLAGDLSQITRKDLVFHADSVYRFVVSWDENFIQFFINSQLIFEQVHQTNFVLRYLFLGRDFTHSIDIQTGYPNNEYSALIGPVYSNLMVWADSVAPIVFPKDTIRYPIYVPQRQDYFSITLKMTFPVNLLTYLGVQTLSMPDLFYVYSCNDSVFRMAAYSALFPLPTDQPIATIEFVPAPDSTDLRVAHIRVDSLLYDEALDSSYVASFVLHPLDSLNSVPVQLEMFEAYPGEKGEVLLRWVTATETDNYGFEVQRSMDGVDFVTIGFVRGRGTSTVQQTYSFVDHLPHETEAVYYRLKQIDFSGAVHFSRVLRVKFTQPETWEVAGPFPNPARGGAEMRVHFPATVQEDEIRVDIFDVLGRNVRTFVPAADKSGAFRVVWDGRDKLGQEVSAGVYFFVLRYHSKKIASRKLLLMR